MTNATEEVQAANGHPDIRLFTVGQGTSSEYPLGDLQTVEQNWTIASNESVSGGGIFGHFSSVCWLFGVQLKQTVLPADVPLGLVSNNWGGTRIEQWSTAEGMHACGRSDDNGNLFNAMIAPYTVGPMTLRGFTWYQKASRAHPFEIAPCATEPSILERSAAGTRENRIRRAPPRLTRTPASSPR